MSFKGLRGFWATPQPHCLTQESPHQSIAQGRPRKLCEKRQHVPSTRGQLIARSWIILTVQKAARRLARQLLSQRPDRGLPGHAGFESSPSPASPSTGAGEQQRRSNDRSQSLRHHVPRAGEWWGLRLRHFASKALVEATGPSPSDKNCPKGGRLSLSVKLRNDRPRSLRQLQV